MTGLLFNYSIILSAISSWSQDGCHSLKHHIHVTMSKGRKEGIPFLIFLLEETQIHSRGSSDFAFSAKGAERVSV